MKYTELLPHISGIYQINFPNNKIYIGRSIDIKHRIWEHYSKIDYTLCQSALKKYFNSYEDIDIDILYNQEQYNFKEQCELEKYFINLKHSNNSEYGYNISEGGDGADYGVNNSASKFSQDDINNIISLLEKQYSNVYISNIYNVHPDTIGRINQGKTYYNSSLTYPIRLGQGKQEYTEKHNSFSNEQLEQAIFLLNTTNKSRQEISNITGIGVSTITNINTGKHPYCKNISLSFPLRKTRKSIRLTQEEIQQIKNELLNPNYTLEEIGKHFNCSYDTISDINKGKRYKQNNEKYPIRNFYPNRGSKKSVTTISGTGE